MLVHFLVFSYSFFQSIVVFLKLVSGETGSIVVYLNLLSRETGIYNFADILFGMLSDMCSDILSDI